MIINCECGGKARSMFFQHILKDIIPTIVFFRPTLKQAQKMRHKKPHLLEHVLMGGLDYKIVSTDEGKKIVENIGDTIKLKARSLNRQF